MLIGVGLLREPLGVAVDEFGEIYVPDRATNRIYKFDQFGKLYDEWGVREYWGAVVPPWKSTWRRIPVAMSGPMSVAVDCRELRDVSIYTGETIRGKGCLSRGPAAVRSPADWL